MASNVNSSSSNPRVLSIYDKVPSPRPISASSSVSRIQSPQIWSEREPTRFPDDTNGRIMQEDGAYAQMLPLVVKESSDESLYSNVTPGHRNDRGPYSTLKSERSYRGLTNISEENEKEYARHRRERRDNGDDAYSSKSIDSEIDKLFRKSDINTIFNRPVSRVDEKLENRNNHIYSYVDSKSNHSSSISEWNNRALLYGMYCSVPPYIIAVMAFILLFSSTEKNESPSGSCCLNMTTDEMEYISLLVSRPFLETFNLHEVTVDVSKALDDKERRFLATAILTNQNLYNDKRQLNAREYTDYYIDELFKYSESAACCSKRSCDFVKNLVSDNAPYDLYVKNTDPLYVNYVYVTKTFCSTYILQLFKRYTQQTDKMYARSRLYDVMYDNKFFNIFVNHLTDYMKKNKLCIM